MNFQKFQFPDDRKRINLLKNPLLVFSLAVVSVVGSVWIIKSDGFYYIDECAHYMYCRFVLEALPITVETWHRPIPQWLFALPAQLGHTFTMFFALLFAIILLYITYRIAVLKGIRHPEWAVLFTGLQPVFFDLSYACMTELPSAFIITLSYLCYIKEKHAWSMVLASCAIMCRTEMFLFAGILFIVYLRRKEWKILPLVFLGPLIWIASTIIISGDVKTFFSEWSRFSSLSKFVPGVSVTHYIENLHHSFGYAQLVFFAAGVLLIAKSKRSAEFGIIFAAIAATIIIHTFAGAEIFNWTASIGELRYMAVIGPFFGIISAFGFSEIIEKIRRGNLKLALSVVVFLALVFNCTLTNQPRRWPNYERPIIELTKKIKAGYPDLVLLCNNSIAAYVMDAPPSGGKLFAPFNKKTLKKYPECIILWDPYNANSVFTQTEITLNHMLQDTTIKIIDEYRYWGAEYLVLYRNGYGTPVR
ncbi:MAG: hypothetical protein JXA06_06620 [Bacteroidetes bacterium]|nr:hypothetical protein [Bacteroidota bacterium]